MSVKTYNSATQMSAHFNSSEIRCPHCGGMKIDDGLVAKIEKIFTKLNASKCIVSSGYRCRAYDISENGFAGRHSEGLAMDVCYYDKNGSIIPSKIVCCVAYDLGELNGIAKIDNNYTHLDNRSGSTYRGDETRGNSSYWTNPYSYFNVSSADVAKYTGTSSSTSQGASTSKSVNVYYRVKTKNKGWLPEVKNLEDYAGIGNDSIVGVAVRVDKGSIKYRVHENGGNWLGYITGCDINNGVSGWAGNNKAIDCVEIYYNTPNDIRPYKRAKYKVNNYSWQYDNETTNGQDGFAGSMGVNATKLQISIE